MRYLNKIIFINSAHIKYAEINLDGNVHFIGTQGVGKSTVLRAILFFYNADKMKLGIQKEQKSFDEFYLPSPDSYIIYEVTRENGRFFIVCFKNQGRAAFRFVDCAYERRFFIDDRGDVAYEWPRINQRIGNHYVSNIIRHYTTYLDIIYGNRQNVQAELRRFSLMESQRYQNVPRSIQNIFLNQSLESRVIKDIIIDSMDFADGGINLNFYRSQVKDFRQQYEDIWKWYRKGKNGHVKVKDDAERVISAYTLYESNRRMTDELCGELTYALDRDKSRLPEMRDAETTTTASLERQRRLLGEENTKYNKERDDLKGKETVLKTRLDDIKKKRQHYDEIRIDNIIAKMQEEPMLKTNKNSLDGQIRTITDQNRSVKDKYDELKRQEKQKFFELANQADRQKNDIRTECNNRKEQLMKDYAATQEKHEALWQQQLNDLQEKNRTLLDDKHDKEKSLLKIQQMNPKKEQMDEYQRKISEAKTQESELKLKIQRLDAQIEHERAETQMERSRIEHEYSLRQKDIEQQAMEVNKQIADLQTLLDKQKGSLIDWLSENVEGWETTLGKVLDEEAVLYNADLMPKKVAEGKDIYGIDINLDNIDRQVRTPEDIRKEKGALDEKLKMLQKKTNSLRVQMQEDIEKMEAKPNIQIKGLRTQRSNMNVEFRTIPNRIESNERLLGQLQEEVQKWRDSETARIKEAIAAIETELQKVARTQGEKQALWQKDMAKMKADFEKQKKAVDVDGDNRCCDIDKTTKLHREDYNNKEKLLDAQMDAELKGSGVDVGQLDALRRQLVAVEDELRFIEGHRRDYAQWQNDKDDLFDHEQEFREQRRQLQQKISDLEDKFAVRRQKYQQAISESSEELRRLKNEIFTISKAVIDTESFISSDSCPASLINVDKEETVKALGYILNELRDNIGHQMQLLERFKSAVMTFRGNFSAQNTFHFKTEFNEEQDFVDFAIDLNEFVSNQKIEEYRQRTSNIYTEIIQRISREVNDLMNHKGSIEKTISDINRDFKENNFAGVIKDIELRSLESNDSLMQLLLTIARFAEQESFNMGELNLFSDQDTLARTNQKAVDLLMNLMDQLEVEQRRETITLADTFKLEFKVRENDNDTGWVEKLSNVGSDGTDILVKAMVNIMLINVFKAKVSRKFGDFRIHCLMDEIGKLHPNNVKGILDFANKRNILLINSSPTTYTAEAYKYTYSLSKDARSNTIVKALLTIR